MLTPAAPATRKLVLLTALFGRGWEPVLPPGLRSHSEISALSCPPPRKYGIRALPCHANGQPHQAALLPPLPCLPAAAATSSCCLWAGLTPPTLRAQLPSWPRCVHFLLFQRLCAARGLSGLCRRAQPGQGTLFVVTSWRAKPAAPAVRRAAWHEGALTHD